MYLENGVIVTITDGVHRKVEAYDLLQLLNELRAAGAEAIAINEQRVVYSTYIVDIRNANTYIRVNGEKVASPYIIKAIGDPTYLESGLSQKGVRI